MSEISRGGREWRLPGLSYADDLVLCGESEQDLKGVAESLVEVCIRRRLKIIADNSKVRGGRGTEI